MNNANTSRLTHFKKLAGMLIYLKQKKCGDVLKKREIRQMSVTHAKLIPIEAAEKASWTIMGYNRQDRERL